MKRELFESALAENSALIDTIRERAHRAHHLVNQHYDHTLPYGHHLDMVADAVIKYGHNVCDKPEEVPALLFGAYFHDSIEDARLTYKDVLKLCTTMMQPHLAVTATEIVYALTNEKGRTRAERADGRYYSGIRATPYAPFVKLADRLANISYSASAGSHDDSKRMMAVYAGEMQHFIESLSVAGADDIRLSIPQEMIEEIRSHLPLPSTATDKK